MLRNPVFAVLLLSLVDRQVAQAESRMGISAIQIPDITVHRSLGLRYESLKILDERMLGLIDQASVTYSLFPAMKLHRNSDKETPPPTTANRNWDRPLEEKQVSLLDISPKVERCFQSTMFCLGFAPITLNMYFNWQRIRTYFSPMIALRIQIHDDKGQVWDLGFESKTFFDKDLVRTLREEANVWTVGRRF